MVSAALGLPWGSLLFMGLGTTAFTLWVSKHLRLMYPAGLLVADLVTCAVQQICHLVQWPHLHARMRAQQSRTVGEWDGSCLRHPQLPDSEP